MATRFNGLSRAWALLVLAALLGALLVACWQPAGQAVPAPKLRASSAQPSDLDLYKYIIKGVAAGGDYYAVAADAQRSSNYPLKPFTTFRLPTHAMAYAKIGEWPMTLLFWALCAGVLGAWWARLIPLMRPLQAGAALALIAGGLGGLLQPVTAFFHESWAAVLLALMVGLYRPHRAWPAMVAGGAALAFRELALPGVGLMLLWALSGRRWREAAAWAAIIAAFFAYLALHAHWVSEVVLAGDKSSPGWTGLNGVPFALKAYAKVTMGIQMPTALASGLIVLSLFGWLSVRAGWAAVAAAMIAGYGAMLALFARTDTFYWALLAAPLVFVGLAFLPQALRDLAEALRGVREQDV